MPVMTEETTLSTSTDPRPTVGSQKTCFVSTDVPGENHEVVAFFGKGVKCTGEIRYEGNVQIDGQLEGTIHTKGTLIVGQHAKVAASIKAGIVVCKGKIFGNVAAMEKVNLLCPGLIDGTLTTPQLSVEEGGIFNGKIWMNHHSLDHS